MCSVKLWIMLSFWYEELFSDLHGDDKLVCGPSNVWLHEKRESEVLFVSSLTTRRMKSTAWISIVMPCWWIAQLHHFFLGDYLCDSGGMRRTSDPDATRNQILWTNRQKVANWLWLSKITYRGKDVSNQRWKTKCYWQVGRHIESETADQEVLTAWKTFRARNGRAIASDRLERHIEHETEEQKVLTVWKTFRTREGREYLHSARYLSSEPRAQIGRIALNGRKTKSILAALKKLTRNQKIGWKCQNHE